VTKSWNRKLIRVTSSNELWSISASIFWTKFGTEHKYHTNNTPEWPNSHKLKIQDGGGRHLEFWKDVNNFGLDKDILHQIIWEDAPRWRGDDHVTKSRNRKLIRVTSSNECLKHICVDLSDCNRYLNQIWYRTQILHYQPLVRSYSHKLKIQDGGGRHLGFRKMSITPNWIAICATIGGQMHHGHAQMTHGQKFKPELFCVTLLLW